MGLQGFLGAMLELESLVKERKALRERQKEQRSLNAMTAQRANRNRDDELDVLLKSKKGNIYLELLEEVKQSCNPRNFEEEVDSDDHDEEEDMEPYKMREFTSGVVREKQKQKVNRPTASNNPISEEQEEEDF